MERRAARRRIALPVLVVLATLLATIFPGGPVAADQAVLKIAGYVNSNQGRVAGARVEWVVVEEDGSLGEVVASTTADDEGNYTLVWAIDPSVPVTLRTTDPSGRFMTTFGSSGTSPGPGQKYIHSWYWAWFITMPSAGRYVPVDPVRVIDTRFDGGGMVQAGESVLVALGDLRDADGGPLLGSATAIVANVTTTQLQCATSFLSAGPGAAPGLPQTTSVVNARAGADVANLVTMRVEGPAATWIYNDRCPVHLIVDLQGFYDYSGGAGYSPITPQRVLDTRAHAPMGAKELRRVDLPAVIAVPEDAVAVAVNVTATNTTARTSYVSAFATGDPFGTESSVLNAYRGRDIANLAVVPLAGDGSIELYNNAGTTDLVLDVAGWYLADGGVSFFPIDHRRTSSSNLPALGPRGERVVHDLGIGISLPAAEAQAVALNLTSTGGTAPTSYVTVYPDGAARPLASNLNAIAGTDLANSAFVRLGPGYRIYNNAGSVRILQDVAGYFARGPLDG